MKHIRKITGLMLSVAAALSLTVPAFASDYSFTTDAPQDYYGSTSYEDVYGSQYNYGGKNVVDYLVCGGLGELRLRLGGRVGGRTAADGPD